MSISPKRRRAILAAHGAVCFYCGTAEAVHVDHIVAQTCGGTSDLGNLIAACRLCNIQKRCDRLPPAAERAAMAKAEELRADILASEQAGKRLPVDLRSVKINIMLTADDVKELEDAMIAERCRSMSAFCRQLILEGLALHRA